MTIQEAQQLKTDAEHRILEIIEAFEVATNTEVEDIEYAVEEETGMIGNTIRISGAIELIVRI
jgi:RNA binding exosome subunit